MRPAWAGCNGQQLVTKSRNKTDACILAAEHVSAKSQHADSESTMDSAHTIYGTCPYIFLQPYSVVIPLWQSADFMESTPECSKAVHRLPYRQQRFLAWCWGACGKGINNLCNHHCHSQELAMDCCRSSVHCIEKSVYIHEPLPVLCSKPC